jgi:hypothetical protein
MVNAVMNFNDSPKVINGCSDLFVEVFGEAGARKIGRARPDGRHNAQTRLACLANRDSRARPGGNASEFITLEYGLSAKWVGIPYQPLDPKEGKFVCW